jgi:non-ribosomal peptide synthetase component F
MKNTSIVGKFEIVASLYPNKLAISHFDKFLSYEELNKRANQFARFLIHAGVKPATFIPIFSDFYCFRSSY